MAEKVYIVDGKKASKLWGGIHFGYNVTQEEIDSVTDDKHGDIFLHVYEYDGVIEIMGLSHVDMCVIKGGISCRDTSHCVGPSCSFCGKFDYY